jgi:hypothetical protein
MRPERIENAIDNNIIVYLKEGKELIDVYQILCDNIKRFSEKQGFIDANKEYLKSNWDKIPIKSRYISYYVNFSKKRKSDFMWMIKNRKKFDNLNDMKLFRLLILRDNINNSIIKIA